LSVLLRRVRPDRFRHRKHPRFRTQSMHMHSGTGKGEIPEPPAPNKETTRPGHSQREWTFSKNRAVRYIHAVLPRAPHAHTNKQTETDALDRSDHTGELRHIKTIALNISRTGQ